MIAVVDYGVGNLRSAAKAIERAAAELGSPIEVRVTGELAAIDAADAVVLPGVGAFGACMQSLDRAGLTGPIRRAIAGGKPFLGICVGMQLLFEESEEFGPVRGLGILGGKIVRFGRSRDRKVPHMGWNTIRVARPTPVLDGIVDGTHVYFVHSYYPVPADPSVVATTTPYGEEFASSVVRDNVFACQFHPEKSQRVGLKLLDNFVRTVR